ncbi:putative transmembrane protein [Tieghemostelium lacteum]|uniref:Putative transmembrane protein n=1 Tax=Tieghemostelium lacteum TaxID=361077 RepID=A0A152A6F4_TIELA|nr:putative transmembrane protein [Tieghemostelium lacteum]|eukprot:KYR01803.1 putative transmembrane protein [Tieghemostelium lacteum]
MLKISQHITKVLQPNKLFSVNFAPTSGVLALHAKSYKYNIISNNQKQQTQNLSQSSKSKNFNIINNTSSNNIFLRESKSLGVRFNSTLNRNTTRNNTTTTTNNEDAKITSYTRGGDKIDEILKSNIGLKNHLSNVYKYAGLSFVGALGSSLLFSTMSIGAVPAALIGLIGSFASIWTFNSAPVTYHNENVRFRNSQVPVLTPQYTQRAMIGFTMLPLSIGLSMSPLVGIVPAAVFMKAAVISGFVTLGSSYYSLKVKPETLAPYRGIAYGSLFGLVGISLIGAASTMIWGPTAFSQTLHSIDIYFGLGLFTFLNAIETHQAVNDFRDNKPDHLSSSMGIFLNTMNIFVRLLEVLKSTTE